MNTQVLVPILFAWLFVATAGADSVSAPGALGNAVRALEAQTQGKVLEIRFVDERGKERFESVVVNDQDLLYMNISSPAQDITQIEVKNLPAWVTDKHWTLNQYVESIAKARIPLDSAIDRAEKMTRAAAIGAGLAKPLNPSNAVLAYYIELQRKGKRERIAIDATDGSKIANPEALYEPWTPVKLMRDQ
jgi:hypothetical protein